MIRIVVPTMWKYPPFWGLVEYILKLDIISEFFIIDNTSTDKSSPVQTITGGTNWKQVSVSGCTAAIKTDGTLWLWGYNAYGTLGDSTRTAKSSPVQTIAGGTNWKQVAAEYYYTAAIKDDM